MIAGSASASDSWSVRSDAVSDVCALNAERCSTWRCCQSVGRGGGSDPVLRPVLSKNTRSAFSPPRTEGSCGTSIPATPTVAPVTAHAAPHSFGETFESSFPAPKRGLYLFIFFFISLHFCLERALLRLRGARLPSNIVKGENTAGVSWDPFWSPVTVALGWGAYHQPAKNTRFDVTLSGPSVTPLS